MYNVIEVVTLDKLVVSRPNILYDYLRENLPHKSKNNIKSLLRNECVFVNGKVITKYDYMLKVNDIIEFNKKELFNLKIVYEDNDIIVVDKPSGILTISNDKEKENTLYREVSNYLKRENKKVFVIHRLDFDTSGIIMFAKNQKVQALYQKDWNTLAKKREYTAVVVGKCKDKGHIESYLKQTKTLFVYSSRDKTGLFAVTDYEKILGNDKYSMLKIFISTGRRNQIRCHMADISHPIVGDTRYNKGVNPINRLCLHANRLEIVNPITNKLMVFTSDIPEEFYEINRVEKTFY